MFEDTNQTLKQLFNMVTHLKNNGSKVLNILEQEEDPNTKAQFSQLLQALNINDNSGIDSQIEEMKNRLLQGENNDNTQNQMATSTTSNSEASLGDINTSIQDGRNALLTIPTEDAPVPNSEKGGFQRVVPDMNPEQIRDDEYVIGRITNLLANDSKVFNRQNFKDLPNFREQGPFSTNDYLRIIAVESNGDTNAVSNKNAHGVMQILPSTAKYVMEQTGLSYKGKEPGELSDKDFKRILKEDPEFNIRVGTRYLDMLYNKFNDKKLALLAYNLGETKVSKLLEKKKVKGFNELMASAKLPKEARDYVPKITGDYNV
jgi:hypothetical protein